MLRATENPSESGGSFDASGAFHGMYSDDDEDHPDKSHPDRKQRGSRVRRVSEGNTPHSKIGGKAGSNGRSAKTERPLNGERPKSLHSSEPKEQFPASEKESRRSLSPISSPPLPSSPAPKRTSAAPNDSGRGSSGGGGKVTANAPESKKKEKASKQDKQQKESAQTTAANGWLINSFYVVLLIKNFFKRNYDRKATFIIHFELRLTIVFFCLISF